MIKIGLKSPVRSKYVFEHDYDSWNKGTRSLITLQGEPRYAGLLWEEWETIGVDFGDKPYSPFTIVDENNNDFEPPNEISIEIACSLTEITLGECQLSMREWEFSMQLPLDSFSRIWELVANETPFRMDIRFDPDLKDSSKALREEELELGRNVLVVDTTNSVIGKWEISGLQFSAILDDAEVVEKEDPADRLISSINEFQETYRSYQLDSQKRNESISKYLFWILGALVVVIIAVLIT